MIQSPTISMKAGHLQYNTLFGRNIMLSLKGSVSREAYGVEMLSWLSSRAQVVQK